MIKKRTSKYAGEGVLRYRKIHNGIHNHRDGQVVRKGEVLYATPDSLSEINRAGFTCIDEEVKQAIGGGIQLTLKARGNGWWDIINKKTGEVLNDTAMRTKDAKEFLSGEKEKEEFEKENLDEDVDDDEENVDEEDEEDEEEEEDK